MLHNAITSTDAEIEQLYPSIIVIIIRVILLINCDLSNLVVMGAAASAKRERAETGDRLEN